MFGDIFRYYYLFLKLFGCFVMTMTSSNKADKPVIRVGNIVEEGKMGGPQFRIVRVARLLHGEVETTVIMPNENSKAFRKLCDESSIPYNSLWMSRITKEWRVALRYFLFSLYEIAALSVFLKKQKFDLIHISGGAWQYKGILAGKIAGTKVIWHLNDTYMPWLFRKLFSILGVLADGYIYSSSRTMKFYKPYVSKEKSEFIIIPPVDTALFSPDKLFSGDMEHSERWKNKIVIGSIGNINPIKGFDLFIQVASILNDKLKDLFFVIVGTVYKNQQGYFKKLKQVADQLAVTNLEFVEGCDDVRSMLKRFDIYVCASVSESGPMTLFEAMAMEKPVVSTDVGDVPVYVRNGSNGFVVPVGDSRAMAERITMLVGNKKIRDDFGQKSRQIAIQELDVKICAERHLDAYNSILNMHNI